MSCNENAYTAREELALDLNALDEAMAEPTLPLPDPYLLTHYRLEKQRVIFLTGTIDDRVLEHAKQIMLWSQADEAKNIPVENREKIYIFINSHGGSDFPSWSLVDAIAMSSTPVVTVNFGIALSNGLTILCAGDKRFALPHSTALYHVGGVDLSGDKNLVAQANKYFEQMDKEYVRWILERTKIDSKLLAKKGKQGDWYIDAKTQLELGIVDSVATSFTEIFNA